MIAEQKSKLLQQAFRAYNRTYLKRSFASVHLDGDLGCFATTEQPSLPLIVCINHSSWWDLLLGVYLDELLPVWSSYTAMDERQLRRYRFFARLGVIGVDRTSLNGARDFVTYSSQLLKTQGAALWLTPQGEMVSIDQRPIHFQPGVGYIAQELKAFYVTTVVFDYEFWNEKLPEAFISVRPLERVEVNSEFHRKTFVCNLERRMTEHIDSFSQKRNKRDARLFSTILSGSKSISPVYTATTALFKRDHLRNSSNQTHGSVITPKWRDRAKDL